MKKGYIEIVSGMFQGHKYGFIHGVTMGRGKGNSLRLIDTKASRVHAEIVSTKEGFVIKDLKSTNGTFVNGEQVKTRLLRSGDRIRLGSTELLFSERDIFAGEDTRTRVKINTERGQVGACGPKSAGGKALLSEIGLQELKDRFQAILRVNRTLGSVVDLQRAFEKLLEEIFSILPADRGAILSVNEETGKLEILCSRTRRGPVDVGDILVSHTILNKVMEESVGLLVEDAASDERFELSESISAEDIRSAMCVPLIQNNETLGIIYLDVQGLQRAFSQQDLDLLMAIAAPASVQVQNALYMERLRHSYWDTISVLSNAIEARDRYTIGHNRRVCRLAMVLATQLGWPEEEIQIVEQGGILHDIGKIGVSDKILLKGDELTEAEWKSMKAHPRIGAEMIKGIEFLRPVLPYVLFHHERWDGSGYPFQLKGQDIPIEGRLLAVCDAFDAMTTKRPYRHGVEPEQAIEEIHRNRDIQFDSKVVDAFVSAWRNGHIQKVLKEQMPRQIPFRPHERHGPVTLPQEHRILQQSRS